MASLISFQNYPGLQNREPGDYFEVNNSQANAGQAQLNTLIIGQKLPAGVAAVGVPLLSAGVGDAQNQFGAGSMLADMVYKYRRTDTFGAVYVLPVLDNPAGVAATYTITVTGAATAAGTINLYAAARLIQCATAIADTPTITAANITAAVNTNVNLPFTATAAAGVVTITARHKGVSAGDIDLRFNALGSVGGQVTPAGLTFAVAPGVVGSADPDLAAALANLPDTIAYDFIVLPYTVATQLNEVLAFLSDVNGTWSWEGSQRFGHAFAGFRATSLSAASTFGLAQNFQHVTVLPVQNPLDSNYMIAAALTAAVANSVRADPGQPLQTVALDITPPAVADQWVFSERNVLLFDGLSTYKVNQAGQVTIDRCVTTYQKNAQGVPDSSYLDTETMFQLADVIRILNADLSSKYARKKLVIDGSNCPPFSNLVTSQTILAECIASYTAMAQQGKVQDVAGFSKSATAENAGGGQVYVAAPIVLANQLRVIATLVAFTKP